MIERKSARWNSLVISFLLSIGGGLWPASTLLWGSGPNITLISVAFFLLFLFTLFHASRKRRLQVPFELLWPALLYTLGAVVRDVHASDGSLTFPAGIVFICTVHAMRCRHAAPAALLLGGFSGALIAILSFLTSLGFLFPTGWTDDGAVRFFGAGEYRAFICTIAMAAAMAFCLLLAPKPAESGGWVLGRSGRLIAAFSALSASLALLYYTRIAPISAIFGDHMDRLFLSYEWPLTLLFTYLAARIMAKLWIAGDLDAPGIHKWLALLTGVLLLLALGFDCLPSVGLFGLLGLMAAYGLPRTAREEGKGVVLPVLLILVLMLSLRLAFLLPGDSRNYAAAYQRMMDNGNPEKARKLLEHVGKTRPLESRLAWIQAWEYLNAGRLEDSADFAVDALQREKNGNFLPPPSPEEKEYYSRALRQALTLQQGDTGTLAQERLLAALGQEESALALLRVRAEKAPDIECDKAPMAQAIAEMVGAPAFSERLGAWKVGELAQCLSRIGASSLWMAAPADFPRALLPLVLVARNRGAWLTVQVYAPGMACGSATYCGLSSAPSPLWIPPSKDEESGAWYIACGAFAEVWLTDRPHILFADPPGETHPEASGALAVLCLTP